MERRIRRHLAAALLLAAAAAETAGSSETTAPAPPGEGGAALLARSVEDPRLRERIEEILARNPRLAAAEARARAAAHEAVRRGALPDPMLGSTAFLAPPETRVGPQRLMLALTQRWPGFGKLGLEERAAALEAEALASETEAIRLELVTEARRLWYELAFVAEQVGINEEFERHLLQHEEIARTRYATGVGPGQGVVKLQAEITRIQSRQLELERRRTVLAAALAALADRPAGDLGAQPRLPALEEPRLDREALQRTALTHRPELGAAAVRVARAEAMEELARRRSRPDFSFGLTYTLVDPRDDLPGRLQPPPGNGDDVFGLQGGVSLPIWRQGLRAARAEAGERLRAAEEARRGVAADIAGQLDELVGRLPLGWRQLRLLEQVLLLQAGESLDSARSGYVAGTLNALDLLDAEHVLFAARTAVARAAADYAIDRARLEGAVAAPLEGPPS
ncbi:MAG: TolC family protein [Thermoanaerobaculia bacterium]|nr:TolC family protein [Thermoanaerobaculia bacterium]